MQPARRRASGQAIVEFALIFPVLFLVLVVMLDLFRIVSAQTAVAEAARQAARQAAANAVSADQPFGAFAAPCSGIAFTANASGTGCLTDRGLAATARQVLGPFDRSTVVYSNQGAAGCPQPASPGTTVVCISPSEAGSPGTYASCAAARSALGRDAQAGDLGSRKAEWTSPQYQGCFVVQVTIKYRYDALTPFVNSSSPNFLVLASTTSMLAEY